MTTSAAPARDNGGGRQTDTKTNRTSGQQFVDRGLLVARGSRGLPRNRDRANRGEKAKRPPEAGVC